MSDPVHNFESMLKKQSAKKPLKLYSDCKQRLEHSIKPRDVISSVSLQLKAIQGADSFISDKSLRKVVNTCKKSSFLSVNNLPVYQEVPKAATKFDTQCVSDTQLINIVENVEILVHHQGVTQEFEASFSNTNSDMVKEGNKIIVSNIQDVNQETFKCAEENNVVIDLSPANIENKYTLKENLQNNEVFIEREIRKENLEKYSENLFEESSIINQEIKPKHKLIEERAPHLCFQKEDNHSKHSVQSLSQIVDARTQEVTNSPILKQDNLNIPNKRLKKGKVEELISQCTYCTNILDKGIEITEDELVKCQCINSDNNIVDNVNIQADNNSKKNIECIENQETDSVPEMPLSPVFINKNFKRKSKSPSPIVFNLDKFESFESIAMPILEVNDLKTARMVINSQILDRELQIKMDETICFNDEQDRYNEDNIEKINEDLNTDNIVTVENVNTDLNVEFIKASSEILNKAMKNSEQVTQNQSQILQDEILFSSDEEEDNAYKNYQDLPFTCALETSFYDQSDVLDKTMYVGFQTASNRSIQICKGSFTKALSLLEDVKDEGPSITELVDHCDVKTKPENDNLEVMEIKDGDFNLELEDTNISNVRNTQPNMHKTSLVGSCDSKISTVTLKPSTSEGFKTASNKTIQLSQKSLARSKKVFQDIDLDVKFNTETEFEEEINDCVGFETARFKDIKLSEKALAKCKQIFQDIDISAKIDKAPKDDVLNYDLANVHNLMDETQTNFDDALLQELETIEISLQESKQADSYKAELGFKPTSSENNKIIDMPVVKAKQVFKDNDFVESDIRETEPKDIYLHKEPAKSPANNLGFKTASNKNIIISKEALVKSNNLFRDMDSTELPKKSEASLIKIDKKKLDKPSTITHIFAGFKTASNNVINISEKALAKVQNIFNDIDSCDFKVPKKNNKDPFKEYPTTDHSDSCSMNENNDVKTAIRKIDIISKEDLVNMNSSFNKNFCKEKQSAALNIEHTNAKFAGFKTAGNRDIIISEEAIANTKNVFVNIDSEDLLIPTKHKREPSSVQDRYKNESIDKVNNNKENVDVPKYQRFQKASIKIVDINSPQSSASNITTELGKKSFESKCNENKHTIKIGFTGFQTASNKKVIISEDALVKTKYIFKDMDSTDLPNPSQDEKFEERKALSRNFDVIAMEQPSTNKGLVGFQTANNKKVNVSKEALAKTKNIFKNIDSVDYVNPNTEKQAQVIESPRKDYFKFINQPSTSKTPFVGFQTGNHKMITVSETALAKTKDIFKDIDSPNDQFPQRNDTEIQIYDEKKDYIKPSINIGSVAGFRTASNKNVKISEVALTKTRNIFKEIDLSGSDLPAKNIKEYYPDIAHDDEKKVTENIKAPKFLGFQTANKKQVKISEVALAKSKNIFQDIDVNNDFNKNSKDDPYHISPRKDKHIDTETSPVFKGFDTASNKINIVCEKKLAKCRKSFQEVDLNAENKNNIDEKCVNVYRKTNTATFTFTSGNNKIVDISKEAILKTKRLFSDIDGPMPNLNANKREKKRIGNKEEIISNIIDTQVLNNFEESLHTEDFRKTPEKSKRSGSPILSCPKAKKRKKFEIPYSQQKLKHLTEVKDKKPTNNNNIIKYDSSYKNIKKYNLKVVQIMTKDIISTIDPYFSQFRFENLLEFKFDENRNNLTKDNMTIETLKEIFLNSVNSKLVPDGWLDNHLKLILWKLISYEVKFKSAIRCNARNVLQQLKFRYDTELYDAKRPALRKIMEKDDIASKTMVLCVVGVFVDGVHMSSISNPTSNIELHLTDGWYCIKACIDKMLEKLVCDGKITMGTKIVTMGAELMNCEQGVSPWEDTSAIRLKIFGNSTRRARWDARLGYHGNTAILSRLSSLALGGGKVSKCRMFVSRVYPALYVHKFEDGSTVTRSERLEHLYQAKMETERQTIMEKIYEEVEKEFANQDSQDSDDVSDSGGKRTCLDSGSQIAKVMKRSKDPGDFKAHLTSSQNRLLEHHTSKRREHLLENIEKRMREKIEKAGLCKNDNVVTLLKIRVADLTEKENGVEVVKGMMSIWKPTEAVLEIIKEGAWIDAMNVIPTAVRYSEIQLSAGRQSVFSATKHKELDTIKPHINLLKRKCYTIKELAQNPQMTTDFNEIDTVGLIFLIDPSLQEFESTKQQFQNVYLTDADKNMVCVNFWGGLKKFGYANVLDTGQTIVCGNLQKRVGNTRKSITQYRVTDFSYFTKSPKNEGARVVLDDLNKKFVHLDRRKFCEDCVVLKNNYSVFKLNNENVSPYRSNITDCNISKNKMFIDSPVYSKQMVVDNLNLTGLDFESTFQQTNTQLPPEILQRKKKVNEKITKLKMYGEPPPLSPLYIINRSKNASNSYKSPLLNNDSIQNMSNIQNSNVSIVNMSHSKSDSSIVVANPKDTPQKCRNIDDSVNCSPVLNRTYVKSVNPIKINFDVKDNNDTNVDHFAGEFDGSPPLSLD